MCTAEENWKVLASLFPAGWQQMAWQSGAVQRLRGFSSPDVLLRMLMLHVARGYSLRETERQTGTLIAMRLAWCRASERNGRYWLLDCHEDRYPERDRITIVALRD